MHATAQKRVAQALVDAREGTIIGVDLAKDVYQLAVADRSWQVRESHRLSRIKFEAFFVNRAVSLVVMEACGSAHHWARWLNGLGIEVVLLPARYIRAVVRRNKTDAADAAALLKAAREQDINRPASIQHEAQFRCRIYDCWLNPVCQNNDQSLAFVGESIYVGLGRP